MSRVSTLLIALTCLAACLDPYTSTGSSGGATSITTWTPGSLTTTTTTTGTTGDEGSGSGGASTTTTSSTTTSSTSTSSTSTSSTTTTDTTTGEVTSTSSSTGTTAVDPVQACLDMVEPGDECTACICTSCLDLWDICQADEGCAAIQACAQKEGCYELQCTFDCSQIIDWYGGIYGDSFKKLWWPQSTCLADHCWPLCPW